MNQLQTATKLVTFDEFIQGYPENSPVRYEIISPTFPDLKITANQIFQAGEIYED